MTRNNVLLGTFKALLRKSYNPWDGLDVKFAGEDGIDGKELSNELIAIFYDQLRGKETMITCEEKDFRGQS